MRLLRTVALIPSANVHIFDDRRSFPANCLSPPNLRNFPVMRAFLLGSALLLAASATAQQYDLLLKGGHVIDPKNNIDATMDVAVAGGKIAAVAANIERSLAKQTIDANGLYVTPGLVDMHVHLFATTGLRDAWAGDNSVYPDGFSFRTGVTTMVDAGTAGWRNFETFRHTVIDRAQTRVF